MYSDHRENHYCRCLNKALRAVRRLFEGDHSGTNYDEIHLAKSLLYSAIGQVEIKVDRQMNIQRQLRELMALITLRGDLKEDERQAGLQILHELISRYGSEEFTPAHCAEEAVPSPISLNDCKP